MTSTENTKKSNQGSKDNPRNRKSSSGGNGQNRKRSRRPRNNRNRKPSAGKNLNGFEKIERAYLNLLEKHLESRKKYFDLYHRADPRQLAKLERSFYRTLTELREYEDGIKEEHRAEFNTKYNGLKLDHTYSENHDISPEAETVTAEGNFDDPHLLPTQTETNFAEDTEESVGSLEDYNRYKGL